MAKFKVGDIVRIHTQRPGLWAYNGVKGCVASLGIAADFADTHRRKLPRDVFPVDIDDPKEGRVQFVFEEDELILWNGMDEVLGLL